MLTVKDMTARVRGRTHDEQETGYTDDTILGYINDGIRFLRRTVVSINPALIADVDIEGTQPAGQAKLILSVVETDAEGNKTAMPVTVTHIAEVRADGRRLSQVDRQNISDTQVAGTPTHYYVQGFNTIGFYPVPSDDIDYEVVALGDIKELTKQEDVSPFPAELDDFLYEYVSLRASLTNEFDMTQEASVMGQIVAQVENLLRQLSPDGVQTYGYWDMPYMIGDYGNRRKVGI